jgi:hypothetical protein
MKRLVSCSLDDHFGLLLAELLVAQYTPIAKIGQLLQSLNVIVSTRGSGASSGCLRALGLC